MHFHMQLADPEVFRGLSDRLVFQTGKLDCATPELRRVWGRHW